MLLHQFQKTQPECGTDEAGRGCIAGPVTAAAVILPSHISAEVINDSKKLSAKQRREMSAYIKKNAIAYGIAHVPPEVIDKINILNASILAMHQSLDQLSVQPAFILVDGNKFKAYKNINHKCIIKGDQKYLSIAAASILAKQSRDDYMEKIHKQYPDYQWVNNKGYPTEIHRKIVHEAGRTEYHRKSFQLKEQLKLSFD
ncbi:MAG: ribonuclease HII [Psychroflexus sp.]|nr:ribonuclease HII [Psychroflexus sp.]MDR9448551.1 ribonuclease HII [Psychroflexus sp.]